MAVINGTDESEFIRGTDVSDTINAAGGNDTVEGLQGSDQIALGAGNDWAIWNVGDGDDRVDGNEGFDTLEFNGSSADETITIAGDRVRVARTVDGAPSGAVNAGGVERIRIATFAGNDRIDASSLLNSAVALFIDAGLGNDTIVGSARGDAIYGRQGNDSVIGGLGDDTIFGGNDNDSLSGGDGNDVFRWLAGGGTDFIDGDAGTDRLDYSSGAAGDEILISSLGSAAVFATPRGEVSVYAASIERANVNGLGGDDLVDARGLSEDAMVLQIDGGVGDDTIFGGPGSDTLSGGAGRDYVSGSAGDDLVTGGSDNDQLEGDAGSDTLVGGTGNDTMTGGSGGDRFLIQNAPGSERDQITDFSVGGGDSLILDGYTDAEYEAGSITNADLNLGNPFISDATILIGGDRIVIVDGWAQGFVAGVPLDRLDELLGDALILL